MASTLVNLSSMLYVCIRSVYVLTTECSSLTVTLVITLRKFVSLLLSIYYFQNPFTLTHWFGTVLVFTGTCSSLAFCRQHPPATEYVCIRSVYVLTTECSSLTVTLVITLRKFVSLLLSIYYFQNPFTLTHWFGTVLVFTGTLLFTGVLSPTPPATESRLKAQ
ncbi:hypothetical protein HPB50_004293 [Hyalomma asiaticum]|uniref:Uncharacterized protein n=1 Tax=Hyalomma asiaticum TaxID=266040 RepID=A0ACB7S075_HYAAI|nr:hypothetical protein HPB50_004293 [Hyalomma asiaticum]